MRRHTFLVGKYRKKLYSYSIAFSHYNVICYRVYIKFYGCPILQRAYVSFKDLVCFITYQYADVHYLCYMIMLAAILAVFLFLLRICLAVMSYNKITALMFSTAFLGILRNVIFNHLDIFNDETYFSCGKISKEAIQLFNHFHSL